MKYVRDSTGRFPERPHYTPAELDEACEQLVEEFMLRRHGAVQYPISTNDLLVLVEERVEDLDLYADLSDQEDEIHGVTEFMPGARPRIRIAAMLTEDPRRENRLRTTITHELGHAEFQGFLFQMPRPEPLFHPDTAPAPPNVLCRPETILDAAVADWMEWQAGYACGAYLMPVTAMRSLVADVSPDVGEAQAAAPEHTLGVALIDAVRQRFRVSRDAARVRLAKLGYLIGAAPMDPLLRAG